MEKDSRPLFLGAVALLLTAVTLGCRPHAASDAHKAKPPAKVAVDEKTLATVTLTPEAESRLAIRTVELKAADVVRKRTFGGEVVVPPGQSTIISAPISGTLLPPENGAVPLAGTRVAAGQAIFRFKPLLTPERDVLTPAERINVAQVRVTLATAQVDAERQVESAKVQLQAAQIAYDRAVQLLRDQAGSQRAVDDADAQLKLAREALATAEARHKLLANITLETEISEATTQTIAAPIDGVLRNVPVAAGETVAAGAPLFEIVMHDNVWIRVPVYVGHLHDVNMAQAAVIAEFGATPKAPSRTARPAVAPPSADPAASSVDLFYELANDDHWLYPGQKVAATLTMRSQEKSLVAPWAAVIYDYHGGAWVYEQTAPLTYVRRRVEVKYVDGADAILAAGPKPGAKLVTNGAPELSGTEFGFGK